MSRKRAVCTGCSQQCGVLAEVEDGQVVRLTGNRADPISGGFICKKGAAALHLQHHPDRLSKPLRRVGPRGGGEWREIDWDKALDEIAATIERLTEEHGRETLAHGIGTLHAADWGLGERFMNIFGSPNIVGQDKVCFGPNAVAEALTYGWGPAMFGRPVPGVTGCEVLWGFRPSASMPLLWGAMAASRKAGAKLVVIDPQRTRETRKADAFLQITPGTDAALALGLIHVLIDEELYDRAFVERATVGFEDLAARARDYPPAVVEGVTGIPAGQVVATARLLGENGPTIVRGGNALCQSGGAVQTGRALACLIAICGSLGVEGGHALAGPPPRIVANGDAVACEELAPEQRAKRLGAREFPISGAGQEELGEAVAGRWPTGRHTMSWFGSAHEPSLWRAISKADPYPVKALILQCHNALGSSADAVAVERALRSENLELLVAHDLFLNKTSSLADYLLPAAHWLEKPYYSVGYGYVGYAGDFVAAERAVLEAGRPSDYDFWRDLGRRLGQADRWPDSVEELWDEWLEPAGLSFAEVCEHEGPMLGTAVDPLPDRFGTPSGKVELRSSLLERWGLDPLPSHETPVFEDHEAADFPLVLTTGGRVIEGFHQHTQQMPAFREQNPHPLAAVHPETAAALGIEDGEWILISTPRGEVSQIARLTEELPPGVVHADRWWYPERADDPDDPFGFHRTNVNMCTVSDPGACEPVMGAWVLRGIPCRIDRLP
ncbi:MAG: molybdopterin-dependent oxidoreductase [Actinobacteria bacterium]|nr:molybdopterin-dependent oxidoreductase [Actinomycetota bacterium]